MHFAKDVQKKILGKNKYDSSYLVSELGELGEEIKKRDWPAIKDEAGDVMYSAQMIAHQKSGINFPMVGADGSIKKFLDRRAIWKQIFKDHGGKFHTDYLKGGSNYARPGKVQKALGMAGINIDDAAAASISAKHTEKTAAEGLSRHGLQISSHDPVDRARTFQQQIANYTQQSERDLRIQKILDRIRDTVPADMDPPELKPHLETRAAKLINAMERDNPLQRSPVLDAFKRNLQNQQELIGIHGEAEVGSNQIWLNRRSLTGDRYADHRGKIPDALLEDIRHPFERAKVSPRMLIAHEAWHAKNPTIPATTWGETPLTPQVNLGHSETLAKYYGGLREVPGENLVAAHARGLNTALKYQAGRLAIPGYYADHTLATAPQRLTSPLPATMATATPVDLSKAVPNVAKGMGKGLGVGIPISMGLDAVAPTTMSTPGQRQQHPVMSYLQDATGHMLDSTKAITGGAATGAVLGGGVGAIPGAVAGGVGDLVHKGWNAAKDVNDIAGNLGGALMGNWNVHKLQNKLAPVGNPSTVIPPIGNSIRNAPSAGGLIKGGADHHNVYVVELLQAALKRKKLLRDNPNADHSKPPLYVGSTGHPVEQRFSNHKANIKGNVFVQKYGLKLRPDLYTKYNPMSFADAEAKEVELAKQLRADGHAVVGGKEKVAADAPVITPESPLHPTKMLQRVGPSPESSVALQGFNRDTVGGFDKGTNIVSHPYLKQHPTGAGLFNMHGAGPPETPGMEIVDPRQAARFQYTVQPDRSLQPNFPAAMPSYPFKSMLRFLGGQTKGLHSVFSESCNPDGGLTPQMIKQLQPGVTNAVLVPPGRDGVIGTDYNDPRYTNASHQLISKVLNPNSPTYQPNLNQAKVMAHLRNITQETAPPNMYRFENNQWVNRGAYNPAEVPTAPMNNFHDDLSNNPIWKKLLSLYPK